MLFRSFRSITPLSTAAKVESKGHPAGISICLNASRSKAERIFVYKRTTSLMYSIKTDKRKFYEGIKSQKIKCFTRKQFCLKGNQYQLNIFCRNSLRLQANLGVSVNSFPNTNKYTHRPQSLSAAD